MSNPYDVIVYVYFRFIKSINRKTDSLKNYDFSTWWVTNIVTAWLVFSIVMPIVTHGASIIETDLKTFAIYFVPLSLLQFIYVQVMSKDILSKFNNVPMKKVRRYNYITWGITLSIVLLGILNITGRIRLWW